MFRNQNERPVNPETGKRYRSRLDEVLAIIKAKALFWDRTSVSVFLAALAVVGIVFLYLGWNMIDSGTIQINMLRRMPPAGSWSFTFIATGMTGFGLNLIIPLPLYWMIPAKRVLQVFLAFLAFNILTFGYGFLIGVISLTSF